MLSERWSFECEKKKWVCQNDKKRQLLRYLLLNESIGMGEKKKMPKGELIDSSDDEGNQIRHRRT